jgi:hypothetical protein
LEKTKVIFVQIIHKFGQDSEFFLWDTKKEKVVPSYLYFPKREESCLLTRHIDYVQENTTTPWDSVKLVKIKEKYRKHPFTYVDATKVRVFRDGLAVEVNTTPTACRGYMWNGIRYALLLAEPWARKPKNLAYTARPWVPITPQLIKHFPDDLKVLGCSPSLDAYTESEKSVAVDPLKTYFRTSGSHLHMSFYDRKGLPPEQWAPFIKLADLLIGVPHTYIFQDELEFKRRKLYGQAGEFRFQEYNKGTSSQWNGIEYRTLSSRLWNHPAVSSTFLGIWRFIMGSPGYLNNMWDKYDPAWEDLIKGAINTGEGLDEAIKISASMLPEEQKMPYAIKSLGIDPLSWYKELRARNLAGQFPDAAIINNLDFGDGHQGFNEYRMAWNLDTPSSCPR